jgi:DNA-binding Xre family transcriptional regulator
MKTFNLKCEKKTIIIEEQELSLPQYIGERVKQISQQKKLSFTTIAKIGELKNPSVCHRVINGKYSITMETFYKICKGLDCKSSDLLPF